ncbi:putative porin [Psychroflexus sediminis]|uniref:Putative porin n=1 Tax=Psychroflexus sediminis TaxID=470826 RepID=A0A1G7VW72_9FLAO|nr:putative porin [Psychroflexus sediminis]SDG63993.1 Putative porin [Psychroflexus sediminis]
MKSVFYIFFILFFSTWSQAQVLKRTRGTDPQGDQNRRLDQQSEDMRSVKDDREKPDISKYKIISISNDTTYVDTTLSIQKSYKFNYLRKDAFDLLPFSNVGRPYTQLGYSFQDLQALPRFGARAKHFNYLEVEDIAYYEVPTPLTELYFKTVFEQGQTLDALFTTNVKPNLNLSIAYKGLRSLGNYQRELTSTGNLRIGFNYRTKNNRYFIRSHFAAQDIFNQENGGLTDRSYQQFINEIEEIQNRAAAEVRLDNAETEMDAKRFYVNHFYNIRPGNDSTQNGQIRLNHILDFTDKEYRFIQASSTPEYFGPTFENTDLMDEVEYQNVANTLILSYKQNQLGRIGFKAMHNNINYLYNSIVVLEDKRIPNLLQTDVISLGGTYLKTYKGFKLEGDATYNITGDFDGYDIHGKISKSLSDSLQFSARIDLSSSAPNLNWILNQSDYENYNWYNPNYENVNTQHLGIEAKSNVYGKLTTSLTQIDNHAYFEYQSTPEGITADSLLRPRQADLQVRYLKIKAEKEFNYGHFNLVNTVMYQNVMEGESIFPVPEFVTRNSLFYDNYLFDKALYLQTGLTFNYFTSFMSKAYDPILSEFALQNFQELDGFYTLDFFLNAKVREARIFFKLENFTTLLEGNTSFAAPRQPYRDFAIRFGLVWNFFL